MLLAVIPLFFASSGHAAASWSFNLTPTLPTGVVGASYSGVVLASGGTAPYKFIVSDGSLPAGLNLNGTTGAISGTPTAAATTYFWIKATDVNGKFATIHPAITVVGSSSSTVSVSVSPTSASVASAGSQQFSAAVKGSTNTGVTWSSSSGTVSSSGLFTAPSVTSSTNVTVTATSAADPTKKAVATVAVSPSGSTISVSISPNSASLTSGNTQQFSATVQGTSNTGVTWSASSGSVSSVGMFTAPSVSSSTNVTVTATSVADTTKKSSATVSVTPPTSSGLTITTSAVPGAQSGTAYSYPLSASGGTTPYQWKVASGSLPQGFVLSSTGSLSGTTTQTGTFTFTAQATDAGNSTASKSFNLGVSAPPPPPGSGGYDGPAQLPVTYMQTSLANTPAPGSTITVSAGGNLQTALNSAQCGDTIALAAGATFTGQFTVPANPCDNAHWIIIRTNAPNSALPPEGSRMLPCYAGVASLPGRPSFSCPGGVTNVLAKVVFQSMGSGPFQFANGANHYRFIGLEITRASGSGLVGALVGAANNASADHIILDRVWMHGSLQDDTMNAFNVNRMSYAALIDSYTTEFHCTSVSGACTDAHVFFGGTSSTNDAVYKVTGNFLEGSTENILFGGGSATTTPTDIEIRRNHFFKPMTWMSGQPGYVGGSGGYPFMVKNHLELKNASRVLVEGNIFENSWGGFSQVGYSILLTPKNQASVTKQGLCPTCAVTDVTIRYNTISHVGAGISLADVTSAAGPAMYGERYSIHDVTIDDISVSKYKGSGTLLMVLSGWPANSLNSVTVNHITGFPDPGSRIMDLGNSISDPQMFGFTFTNNIVSQVPYPIWSTGGSTSNCAYFDVPLPSLNSCFTSYKFIDNAIVASINFPSSKWPTSNYFPANVGAIQFVSYNNGNGGDYHLASGSPYKNAASDGKDIGADVSAIQSLIAGVY